MMYLFLLSGISIFGLVLLVLGLRGKRVDDHPLCRKCKYDLVGTEQLPANCPECGSELNKPRSTRIGNRNCRHAMLAVGLVILASSLTTGGFLGWAQAKNFDWYPYKPLWMLQAEIEQDPGIEGAKKATAEIFKRLHNDKLSDRQIRNVINITLELQTDPSANWNYFWGEFLEEAWLKGKTTDEKLEQYCKELFNQGIEFVIASRARSTELTPYIFENQPCRGGRGAILQAYSSNESFALDGEVFVERYGGGGRIIRGGPGGGYSGARIQLPDLLGKHTLSVIQKYWVYVRKDYAELDTSNLSHLEKRDLKKSIAKLQWSRVFKKSIEIVGPDDPVVDLIEDESLTKPVRDAIQANSATIMIYKDRMRASCQIELGKPPIAVVFDIYWRVGDRDWLIDAIASDKKGHDRNIVLKSRKSSLDDFPIDAEKVDIILRCNPDHAFKLVAPEQVWNGKDIVIKDYPLIVERRDE